MWKDIKTVLLGCVLVFLGLVVIPLGTTIMVKGLEAPEIRFEMPDEIEVTAKTGSNYNVFREFMNVFRTQIKMVDQTKFLPEGVEVIVENFDGQKFKFWIQFGYIVTGSILAIMFTVSGVVCIFLAYVRLTYRDPMGVHGEPFTSKDDVESKAASASNQGSILPQSKVKSMQRRRRTFMGMHSSF